MFSKEPMRLEEFIKESPKKHFCEFILKYGQHAINLKESGPSMDHYCEVKLTLAQLRRCHCQEKTDNGHMTDYNNILPAQYLHHNAVSCQALKYIQDLDKYCYLSTKQVINALDIKYLAEMEVL